MDADVGELSMRMAFFMVIAGVAVTLTVSWAIWLILLPAIWAILTLGQALSER